MSDKEIYLKSESFTMIGCAMRVHRELGNGFLEGVYQEALAIEFSENNVPYEREKSIRINYKGKVFKNDIHLISSVTTPLYSS